jgi:hypothetical protein
MSSLRSSLLRHDHVDLIDRDPQGATGCACHGAEVGALTGEEAELSEELERAKGDEGHLGRLTVVLDDVDFPLQDDYQVIGLVAVGEENVTHGAKLCSMP